MFINISKLKLASLFLLIFLLIPNFLLAKNNQTVIAKTPNPASPKRNVTYGQTVNLYFFYSKYCPHCEREAVFLSQLKNRYQNKVKIYAFEIAENSSHVQLLQKFGHHYSANVNGVPIIFIGEQYIIGYYNDESTGIQIQNLVDQCLNLGCRDLGSEILYPEAKNGSAKKEPYSKIAKSKIVKIPFKGKINLQNTSLFITTVIIGALDGFNPCAMWVLIFLISLLLSMESIKKRWILGITFIAGSAIVYYLFMAVWLNLFLFIGYLLAVRIIIGGFAIIFGIYSLNKFIKNKSGTCEVTNIESRQRTLGKLRKITLNRKLLPAMLGVVLLAFAVNLVELACSAGFPAVYTEILASRNLSTLSYYLYLLLYIIIFMLDDIIVFVAAMITLRLTGLNAKYSKFSNLIGGIIILILGILLIFKPDLLMF